jgi:diadenylate cyclase
MPLDWLSHFLIGNRTQLIALGSFLLSFSILTGLIYGIYVRFIRHSQAEQLLKGLLIILFFFVGTLIFTSVFYPDLLGHLFSISVQTVLVGLIVIFQPELRRMLLFLGQGELFGTSPNNTGDQEETHSDYLVSTLTETVRFLSKAKRGALIVLESANSHGGEYLEMGTSLNARLSTELMLTIFHLNTPLHDGAVVIGSNNRVLAAGVLLPLTEDPKLSWQYGTRHRAAIGLTEISDSRCLVVSEETGSISLAQAGKLEKFANAEELRKTLSRLYQVSSTNAEEANSKRKASLQSSLQKLFQGRKVPPSTTNKH